MARERKPDSRRGNPGSRGGPWANASAKSNSGKSRPVKPKSGKRTPKPEPGSAPDTQRSGARVDARADERSAAGSSSYLDRADSQLTDSGPLSPPAEGEDGAPAVTVKLQKLLADAGLGSRRELERWIASGRVLVDGTKATLGDRVTGNERIEVDGKALGGRGRSAATLPRVVLINKSEGVICTRRDPEGRKTVFADLPSLRNGRWISIGRLDVATTGLLLLCNDGELAHRMMHPSTGLDREYAVRTDVILEDEQLKALKAGIESEGETLRFADIRYFDGRGSNHWYHVVLLEGRNHEVRRLFASVGAEVRRLKRVRYGPVLLPSWLRRGQRFELNNADVSALYRVLGMQANLPPERPGRKSDRRSLADRSVLIPYPDLPGVEPAPAPSRQQAAGRKPQRKAESQGKSGPWGKSPPRKGAAQGKGSSSRKGGPRR